MTRVSPYELRRANARGFCGNPEAPFPLPLADYLDVDRDGHVSFCYPLETGAFHAILGAIRDQIETAMRHRRATDRAAALKQIAAYVTRSHDEHQHINLQWSAHLDALEARHELAEAQRAINVSPVGGAAPAAKDGPA